MTKSVFRCLAILLLLSTFYSVTAQQLSESDTIPGIEAVAVSEVTAEVTRTNTLLLEKQSILLSQSEKSEIKQRVDTLSFKLNMLREDPRIHRIATLNFRSLGHLSREWANLKLALENLQNELSARVKIKEDNKSELEELISIWDLTLDEAVQIESPESVIEQIKSTRNSIEEVNDSLLSGSQFIQDKLVILSNNIIVCNNITEEIESANEKVSSKVFEINQEAVWNMFKSRSDTVLISSERSHIDDIVVEIKGFAASNSIRILLHILFIILIFILVISLNRNIDKSIPENKINEIATIKKIAAKPISVSVLLGFLSSYIFYPVFPEVLILVNTIILLIPVIIILTRILPETSRRVIIIPLVSLVLVQFHSLGYSETIFSRIYLMSVIGLLIFILTPIVRNNLSGRNPGSGLQIRNKALLYILILAYILLSVALFASIAGAVMLTEYLTYALIKSASLILIIYAIRLTLNSTLYILLHSRAMQKLNIIAQYHINIYKRSEQVVNLVSWLLWIIFTLQLFAVWDKVYSFISGILTRDISANIATSLGDILLFVIVIIITFWLARFIKILIEGEIAPRVKMKRGVPGAMSLLLRIGIITIGFLFAARAAGFGMDRLTILLGALGVGIGFGLQNIFNNLVSGIILAFERPIQEGDIIEVGELWGTVKEIGIRSSTIFTFDGAEVIVPNGNLISNQLINWTLTDRNRRAEVIIGVAYGSDPDIVLHILKDIAGANKNIKQEPAPLALFTGFGDSSLDFKLLFWITRADNRYIIQSEINVAINKALKDAGIEIPFPQQDLHIRSVDKDVKFKNK